MPFDHYAAALAFGKRTQFLKIIRAEQHGTARRTALRFAQTKNLRFPVGFRAECRYHIAERFPRQQRLITRQKHAAGHGRKPRQQVLQSQPHGVAAKGKGMMQDGNAAFLTQCLHLGRAGNDHAVQPLCHGKRTAEQRFSVKFGEQLVGAKPFCQAGCHDHTSDFTFRRGRTAGRAVFLLVCRRHDTAHSDRETPLLHR